MFLIKNLDWRLVRLTILTAALMFIGLNCQSKQAQAVTVKQNQGLGYPHSQMPCEHYPYNISGACANYDWGPFHTEIYDHPSEYSSRGYTFRNCTDYVAWKLGTLGVKIPRGLGNAADWYGHVAANQRSSRAKAWDVAVRPGGFGHVAFVEAVVSVGSSPANDVITISEYNFYGLGTGSVRIGQVAELGFTTFIDFGVHPAVVVAQPVAVSPTPTPPSTPVVKEVAPTPSPAKPAVAESKLVESTPAKPIISAKSAVVAKPNEPAKANPATSTNTKDEPIATKPDDHQKPDENNNVEDTEKNSSDNSETSPETDSPHHHCHHHHYRSNNYQNIRHSNNNHKNRAINIENCEKVHLTCHWMNNLD